MGLLARGTSLLLSFKWGYVGMMAMEMAVSVTSFAQNEYRKEFTCCVTREGGSKDGDAFDISMEERISENLFLCQWQNCKPFNQLLLSVR